MVAPHQSKPGQAACATSPAAIMPMPRHRILTLIVAALPSRSPRNKPPSDGFADRQWSRSETPGVSHSSQHASITISI